MSKASRRLLAAGRLEELGLFEKVVIGAPNGYGKREVRQLLPGEEVQIMAFLLLGEGGFKRSIDFDVEKEELQLLVGQAVGMV